MNWMVADGESVDGGPQTEARPFAGAWFHLACDDEYDEIACLCGYDREASPVLTVAYEAEQEDDGQCEKATDCREGISFHAREAQRSTGKCTVKIPSVVLFCAMVMGLT
ncbi:hypothetical protein Tdes44962_MAKER08926 [Teratosphaeria destructans]|uniref:Uncharacterized protein n=1 Tax=Teratosphaeria destructans TaxID=418781 RepID=A0A9W7W453_9PEZI|nr:hypothetical protein Tdes44962_MAKER08926 [Teratosphaeria destructans]